MPDSAPAESFAGEGSLSMPLEEAMRTQRAIRRLKPDPVDDRLVLRLIELAQKAPTGSNAQNWEFVVVKDPAVKAKLGRLNRLAWTLYGGIGRRMVRNDPPMQRILNAVQWQADHFEEIPVIVVACLRGPRIPFPIPIPPIAASSTYGSIYPSVQNLLLAARAAGLGAALITLPLWSHFLARRALGLPWSVSPCAVVPLGWPRGRYGPTTRRPVGEVVHVDRFGNHRCGAAAACDGSRRASRRLREPRGARRRAFALPIRPPAAHAVAVGPRAEAAARLALCLDPRLRHSGRRRRTIVLDERRGRGLVGGKDATMVSQDLYISNARIVDGTGAPERRGAVAVRDGKIAAAGPDMPRSAAGDGAREIDARGQVVAPGFIDVHTHFDPQICWDRLATPSIEHGVTTVLMGNCSLSLAPVRKQDQRALAGMFKQIEDIPLETFAEGVPWSWETYPEYLDFIRKDLGINVAGLVGHSALRSYVMGAAAQERAATEEETAQMGRVLQDAIRGGAAGLSTSYVDIDEHMKPVPSRWATRDEVIALGRAMAEVGRGLIQTVPVFYNPPEQLQNIRDMGEISRQTGLLCSVAPIVHSTTSTLWQDSLAALEEEKAKGARVFGQSMPRTFDINIRLAESSFLLFAMPAWAEVMRMPLAERCAAFADPARRADLRMQFGMLRFGIPMLDEVFEVGRVARPENRGLEGRKVAQLAAERGVEIADAMLDVALSEGLETEFALKNFLHVDPAGVTAILSHPLIHIGASDAGAHISQFCGAGDTSYLLGRWVRDLHAFTLERAVQRLTGELADAFGIRNRGRIAPGLAADLVLFDPDRIDRGSEDFVHDVPGGANRYVRHAQGIDKVMVNGAVVWEDGAYTGARTGEVV
jgi:N-acyl-D-amino-acid deacylase